MLCDKPLVDGHQLGRRRATDHDPVVLATVVSGDRPESGEIGEGGWQEAQRSVETVAKTLGIFLEGRCDVDLDRHVARRRRIDDRRHVEAKVPVERHFEVHVKPHRDVDGHVRQAKPRCAQGGAQIECWVEGRRE